MSPYLVCEFGKSTISNLIKECFGSEFSDVFSKPQLTYIYQYLLDIGAKSVLLEREYLDKDYLEDYASYYVKCFNNGGHKCARLHFFSEENVNHKYIDDVLNIGRSSKNYKPLIDSYLGFMVVRPLPLTFIGKTCVKKYPKINQAGSEKVCISRAYKVDLFGIPLSVESVAFQEQDRVVAACATTSIWAAFHAMEWNSEKQIPSCSEITTRAINHVQNSNNGFPNKGLSIKQILRALDVEGLRYYHEDVRKRTLDELYETVRIHISSGVPLILCADVFEYDRDTKQKKSERLGMHAVTIVGYSEAHKGVYLHDDRLGPFVYGAPEPEGWALKRRDASGVWLDAEELLVPNGVIIPTNKKARIPYDQPLYACRFISREWGKRLRQIFGEKGIPEADFLELEKQAGLRFELRLSSISDIRNRVLNHAYDVSSEGNYESKRKFLTGDYARLHWEAAFIQGGKVLFRVLFDATEIPQGNVVSGIFIENPAEAERVLNYFGKYAEGASASLRSNDAGTDFFLAFLRFLKRNPAQGFEAHLDRTYGELRAPRYLKENEIVNGEIGNNSSLNIFYEGPEKPLSAFFANSTKILWAIGEDGGLLFGQEFDGAGHPTLTGFKPARIAGEIILAADGRFIVSSKSGRYSSDYANKHDLLRNAVTKIRSFFPKDCELIDQEDTAWH
ncbi:MAG: hypothetical protein H6Q76_501 [Firmicutes bacterium]|nr:hypothetical protein [Bacillota bacterium]